MQFLSLRARSALAVSLWLVGAIAHAAVLATATPGVTLTLTTSLGNPGMSVGYVPAFQRYYGGSGNGPGVPMAVFTSTGVQLANGTPGVDVRGLYFNSSNGNLEAVAYNACCGSGSVTGVQRIDLDGSGNLVGTNSQLLAGPIAGLGTNSQTMPSYDPAANRLYAKQSGSADVTVANRTTGALMTTITLNLAAAGVTAGDVNDDYVGFTGATGNELVTYDFTNHRALVFDLAGTFVGASALPAIPVGNNQSYGTAYENGQFFVFDDTIGAAGGAWRGFTILSGGPPPPATSTPVPALTGANVAILCAMLGIFAIIALRRQAKA
jgi:hypothetical protein